MRVGESGVAFPIDSLAGEAGQIPSTAGAVWSLIVKQRVQMGYSGTASRVVVPPERLVPTGDGRTFVFMSIASDFPIAGSYDLQLSGAFPNNATIRLSEIGNVIIENSL